MMRVGTSGDQAKSKFVPAAQGINVRALITSWRVDCEDCINIGKVKVR
jgi:hypothetical protein